MTEVVFLGFALPEDEFRALVATDAGLPIATQRFGWSVVEALESAGWRVFALSAAPASDFPHNKRIVFSSGRFSGGSAVSGWLMPFVNVTGLKHLSRYISATWGLARRVRRGRTAAIVVHGVHSPFIWAAVHASRWLPVPVVVVMTDPPSLRTRFDHGVSLAMKRVDRRLIASGLQRVDGVITLTPALAGDFAPGKPALLMEGIARPLRAPGPPSEGAADDAPPIALYAGGLREEYGVRALIDAVGRSRGSWHLHIYGNGPMADECRHAEAEDPRIFFHGVADTETLGRAYSRASVLVNPRQLNTEFVQYSFPSKLLEYMTTSTPVVTTHLPTIPSSWDPFVIYTGEDSASIATTLDSTLALAPEELRHLGSAANTFIADAYSPTAQGARITAFLRMLSAEPEAAP
ncbi:glycosyltransferase family 4 protein [Phycicoccus sonneratiae]|uniref:Glycosyltransferase family 4 protein n=1 Tax=Phycicoccus sonneratiae TaxID=2807628 RepID=A0ABS2CPY6_9MICO|nr:glycosyltransferase family 4 protein [Phycicoccus sonneraticus]MBM6401109.1 glycosyltransferase family 4 protein [Phycicoccus sonneraticus]